MNIHEIEEAEFGRGSQLWDADPDVCCAAFQLGACVHTESMCDDDWLPEQVLVCEFWPDFDWQAGNDAEPF